MKRYIAYYQQGAALPGLDTQRQLVSEFVRARGGEILQEFIEVEGKDEDRPQLKAASMAAYLYHSPLLVSSVGPMAQAADFLRSLMGTGVHFVCAETPEICDMTIDYVVAQAETAQEEAQEAAELASLPPHDPFPAEAPATRQDRALVLKHRRRRAIERAERYRALIRTAVLEGGCMNPAEIARYFNANETPMPSGKTGTWQNVQVMRTMKHLDLTVRGILQGEEA